MDLVQLRTFVEAANSGSLTGASKKLCTSQPAVSRQIITLEKELELSLFSRHSRGIRLTEAGRCLFQYAEKALLLLNKAEKSLAELRGLESGLITVGASTTIGNYLFPSWLAYFNKTYPKIDVYLQIENSNKVIESVLDGKLDIGLIAGPIDSHELCQEYLFDDEIILLVGPEHPWLKKRPVLPSSLEQEILVLRETGSATRQAIESYLDKKKILPKKTLILGNTEAIKRAVMAGLGVTFISRHTTSLELEHNLLYEIMDSNLNLKRPLFAIYPKGVRLAPSVQAFLSTIVNILSGLKLL